MENRMYTKAQLNNLKEEAIKAGANAGAMGMSISTNPYDVVAEKVLFEDWNRGWKSSANLNPIERLKTEAHEVIAQMSEQKVVEIEDAVKYILQEAFQNYLFFAEGVDEVDVVLKLKRKGLVDWKIVSTLKQRFKTLY